METSIKVNADQTDLESAAKYLRWVATQRGLVDRFTEETGTVANNDNVNTLVDNLSGEIDSALFSARLG